MIIIFFITFFFWCLFSKIYWSNIFLIREENKFPHIHYYFKPSFCCIMSNCIICHFPILYYFYDILIIPFLVSVVVLDTTGESSLEWTRYPYGPQASTPGVSTRKITVENAHSWFIRVTVASNYPLSGRLGTYETRSQGASSKDAPLRRRRRRRRFFSCTPH